VAENLGSSRRRSYGVHFAVAYFVLAAILGAAVGAFVVFMGRDPSTKTEWSAWAPNGSADERVTEISNRIATRYRLPSGNQLVTVYPQPPSRNVDGQMIPIRAYAVATPSPTTGRPNITPSPTNRSVEYILCGFNSKDCSISEGTPSAERLQLLRRQALELALYTFRYVDGIESVFAVLPPQPGNEPSFGLFFRKSDLKDELSHPLRRTLPQDPPPLATAIDDREQSVINRLTSRSFYKFGYQQVADGSIVLVLQSVA
jgi:hypothetical protein